MNKKKRCPSCETVKPTDAFSRDVAARDGFKGNCKQCCSVMNKRVSERNRNKNYLSVPDKTPSVGVMPSRRKEDAVSVPRGTVLCIGDTHFPWHNNEALKDVYTIAAAYKPAYIVQLGDLYDFYSFSRYPRSVNTISPRDELEKGRQSALFMWKSLREASPDSKCYQLMGNHDDRPIKRIISSFPEGEDWIVAGLRDLFEFDGVETINHSRQELVIEGTYYMHGYRKHGEHARWNRASTVVGHLHRGGVLYWQGEESTIFELNAGCLVDCDAPVFSYNAQKNMHGMTIGVGLVDRMGPRFIPLPL